MAKFYGQFMVESFKRQMKENRKIEELILMFATHATAVLKKEPSLGGDGWKLELNKHIALFVKMLRECLRNVHHVSPELLSRLDMYTAKLAPTLSQTRTHESTSSRDVTRDTPAISDSISDMRLVLIVSQLFKLPEHAVQKEVDQMRAQTVSEKVGVMSSHSSLQLTLLRQLSWI
jgi:hypothetical protein